MPDPNSSVAAVLLDATISSADTVDACGRALSKRQCTLPLRGGDAIERGRFLVVKMHPTRGYMGDRNQAHQPSRSRRVSSVRASAWHKGSVVTFFSEYSVLVINWLLCGVGGPGSILPRKRLKLLWGLPAQLRLSLHRSSEAKLVLDTALLPWKLIPLTLPTTLESLWSVDPRIP